MRSMHYERPMRYRVLIAGWTMLAATSVAQVAPTPPPTPPNITPPAPTAPPPPLIPPASYPRPMHPSSVPPECRVATPTDATKAAPHCDTITGKR